MTQQQELELVKEYDVIAIPDRHRGEGWNKYLIHVDKKNTIHVWECASLGGPPCWTIAVCTDEIGYRHHVRRNTLGEALGYAVNLEKRMNAPIDRWEFEVLCNFFDDQL